MGSDPLATGSCPKANGARRNSYNGLSAKTNDNGAHMDFSGGCDDARVNGIRITPGRDYAIRAYPPRAEALGGSRNCLPFEPID